MTNTYKIRHNSLQTYNPTQFRANLHKNTLFQFFKYLKNHLLFVTPYYINARLDSSHFNLRDSKNRLEKLEKLNIRVEPQVNRLTDLMNQQKPSFGKYSNYQNNVCGTSVGLTA